MGWGKKMENILRNREVFTKTDNNREISKIKMQISK
jgi:hypothetical protein